MRKEISSAAKMIWASAGVVLLIMLASWICRPSNAQVPDDLIGDWHTSDPNYSDRSFEIDPVSINFGTGGGTVTTGFIKKVTSVSQGARTLYTVSYIADDSVEEVSFYYDTARGKVIRFRNQEGIAWTKD